MVPSLRATPYLVFFQRETLELLWEYSHSSGDGQRTGHSKREVRIGTLTVEKLISNVLLPWETYQNENERKEKREWAYSMGPSENEFYW